MVWARLERHVWSSEVLSTPNLLPGGRREEPGNEQVPKQKYPGRGCQEVLEWTEVAMQNSIWRQMPGANFSKRGEGTNPGGGGALRSIAQGLLELACFPAADPSSGPRTLVSDGA